MSKNKERTKTEQEIAKELEIICRYQIQKAEFPDYIYRFKNLSDSIIKFRNRYINILISIIGFLLLVINILLFTLVYLSSIFILVTIFSTIFSIILLILLYNYRNHPRLTAVNYTSVKKSLKKIQNSHLKHINNNISTILNSGKIKLGISKVNTNKLVEGVPKVFIDIEKAKKILKKDKTYILGKKCLYLLNFKFLYLFPLNSITFVLPEEVSIRQNIENYMKDNNIKYFKLEELQNQIYI